MEGSSAYTTLGLTVSVNQVRSLGIPPPPRRCFKRTAWWPPFVCLPLMRKFSFATLKQLTQSFPFCQFATQLCSPRGSPGQGRNPVCFCSPPQPLFPGICLPLKDFFRACLATATLVESYHESRVFEASLLLIFDLKRCPRASPGISDPCSSFLEFQLMPMPFLFSPYFL